MRIFFKECTSLAQAGHKVVLIAPHSKDEIRDGISIKSVPRPKGRWRRLTRTMWQVFRAARRENGDVYHFHDSELLGVGLLLKLSGKKVIYDVHEDVPRQILINPLIPRELRRPLGAMAGVVEFIGALFFDRIVAATPTIARRFPAAKTVVVENFPLLDEFDPALGRSYGQRDAISIYVGIISIARGAKQMMEAVALLPQSLGARLLLVGKSSPASVDTELREMPGAKRADIVSWQTRGNIANLLAEARIGLVVLHPTANYIYSYPVKLFEYMAMGIPVIASDFPLWREIIEGEQCGLLVDPLDPPAIAHAIEYLLTHPEEAEAMGQRGREAVEHRYNWKHAEAKLITLYAQLGEAA